MAKRPAKTQFVPRNVDKYVGPMPITLRSNWERVFCAELDNNPAVIAWAWESEQIPYFDPTPPGKQSIYIPDCLVRLMTVDGTEKVMLIEIKPAHEALSERTRNDADLMILAKNRAKWAAAQWWCERRGIEFRVMTEDDLFDGSKPATTIEHHTQKQLKQKAVNRRKASGLKTLKPKKKGNPLYRKPRKKALPRKPTKAR